MNGAIESGPCHFSNDRVYRYRLSRMISESGKDYVLFIMLNPSTADENVLDPTLRRCARFASDWGFRAMAIANLFAFRATSPKDLKAARFPVGPWNDAAILSLAHAADNIIVGWGNHGDHEGRAAAVMELLAPFEVHHLGLTKSGQPKHPLYLRADTGVTLWGK